MSLVRINIPSKNPLPDLWREIQPDFPMPSPRKYQDDALNVIYYALQNDDFDNIVIQAPTGIGKSAIAMTVQRRFQSAYLLSPSLGLTDQYLADYGRHLAEVRGRGNFPCWVRSGNADGAPCYGIKQTCPHTKRDDPCPYYEQKFKAADARLTLSNPAYLFRVIQGNSSFDQREFAIIDEAHNLESFFMGLMEVKISERDFVAVGLPKSLPVIYHAADWEPHITDLYHRAIDLVNKSEKDEDEKGLDRARKILRRTSTFIELLEQPNEMVVETGRDRLGSYVRARPIRVNRFAGEYLEQVAQKRIFLSATILDCETFLTNLGIENQRTLYVNVNKSPFPSENFNIFYAPCGPMSYGKRDTSLKKQVKAIAAIMEKNTERRGVILPHTHYIRQALVDGLTDLGFGDRILTHGSDARGRKTALDIFFKSPRKDLVLISTYVGEGFDFKGTLAEWLVICKVPFLPIKGDPQIELRMVEDEMAWRRDHEGTPACPYEPPNKYSNGLCSSYACAKPCMKWYDLQTALKLVQGSGRIIRTSDDKGDLFILDGSFSRWSRWNTHLLPGWFRNSIREPPNWLKRVIG